MATITTASGEVIKYKRLLEGLAESGDDKGARASITFQVPYSQRWAFLQEVFGAPTTLGGAWRVPTEYEDKPGLYAMSFNVTGVGGTEDPLEPYSFAKVDIGFETPSYDFADDVWYSKRISGSSSIVTMPFGTLEFSDGTPLNVESGKLVSEKTIILTRFKVPTLATIEPVFDALLGHVNSSTFMGNPAETVLFETYETQEDRAMFGSTSITATIALRYRTIPWNSAIRPGTGDIEPVTYRDGSTKPFATGNLMDLIS